MFARLMFFVFLLPNNFQSLLMCTITLVALGREDTQQVAAEERSHLRGGGTCSEGWSNRGCRLHIKSLCDDQDDDREHDTN